MENESTMDRYKQRVLELETKVNSFETTYIDVSPSKQEDSNLSEQVDIILSSLREERIKYNALQNEYNVCKE